MVAGAGGMWVAAQEIARLEREISCRRAIRQARREGMRERLSRYEHFEHETAHRVDFDCFHLCAHCGYLSRGAEGVCPACKVETWLDLGDHLVADSVRDEEIRTRRVIPAWIKVGLGAVLTVTMASVVVCLNVLWLYDLGAYATWLVGLGAFAVAVVVYLLAVRPLAVLLLRARKNKPYRWHLPMPLSDATTPVRTILGTASLTGEPLIAPFSRRGCIAYQACVLFDTPGDARPPEWVIQESFGIDFEVEGDAMDGDHVLVRTPLEEIPLEQAEADGLDLARYLRERGLFVSDGEYELYEAIVVPGERVRVKLLANPPTTVVEPIPRGSAE